MYIYFYFSVNLLKWLIRAVIRIKNKYILIPYLQKCYSISCPMLSSKQCSLKAMKTNIVNVSYVGYVQIKNNKLTIWK